MEISFNLYNENSVDRLQDENPDILPDYTVDESADLAYNKEQINSAIESAIIQGKSIDGIADDLQDRLKSINESSAVKTARTAMTNAQAAGTLESFYEAQELGIEIQKEWLCTQDDRTRPSHLEIDGERRDLDEEFSNGLQYPGDSSGEPGEVYNCRCTMVAYFPDIEEDLEEAAENEKEGEFEDWQKDKEEAEKEHEEVSTEWQTSIGKDAANRGVEYIPVKNLDKINENTRLEIELQIAGHELEGPDQTDGSCVSVGLAACGRVAGYDVLDFRGGDSQFVLSYSFYGLGYDLAISGLDVYASTSQEAAMELISKFEDGEVYFMGAGAHAAIVMRDGDSFEYLELQSDNGGWYFAEGAEYIAAILDWRFKTTATPKEDDCDNTHAKAYKVKDIVASDNLREILGFINTNSEDQLKGEGGSIK